jgi:GT2 family glycosyltransferase
MTEPALGVVIVSFNSSDVILDCLESLLAAGGVRLAITVVDNASTDGTPAFLRDWAAGRRPYSPPKDMPISISPAQKPISLLGMEDVPLKLSSGGMPTKSHTLTLIETGVNGGFAAGVNRGLAYLYRNPEIGRFWILNPDGISAPDTPRLFATAPGPDKAAGGSDSFALMGGRVLYLDGSNDVIQTDGGTIRRTGVSASRNMRRHHPETPEPDPASLDFLSGASLVASRTFYETVGPMCEDYFLYYEEVDWACRRGALPLAWAKGAIIWHRAGTSIGSGRPTRAPSDFSLYFLHRARMRFVRRYFPWNLPVALALSVYKAGGLAWRGHSAAGRAVMAGSLGMGPPVTVRARLSEQAQRLAFGI